MARFTGIPSVPPVGIEEWQARMFNAMKQNIELLIGARGESDGASRAVLRSSVASVNVPAPQLRATTAIGSGFSVGGAEVPSLADYQNLVRDVQLLSSDVATLRQVVEVLVAQLRS